jgi:hypothetical protein
VKELEVEVEEEDHPMYEFEPDIPDKVLLYDAAMGGHPGPPPPGNDEFVEFLRTLLHRYGADKSAANCCRTLRGFRCPVCHSEDARLN